jgi:hypothetical protein
VLKPGGKCLATFFIYDRQQEESISRQRQFNFPVAGNGYRLMDAQVRSANVALAMTTLQSMAVESKLAIAKYIEGYWKQGIERSEENSFQDIVVVTKG